MDPAYVDHPEVTEALTGKYTQGLVILFPLASGNVAVFGRDLELHAIIDGFASLDVGEIRSLSAEIKSRIHNNAIFGQEARFYGEPDDKQFKKDVLQSRKPAPRIATAKQPRGQVIDIDL